MDFVKEKTAIDKLNLGNIPQDWSIKELGELGNIVNGLTYSPKDVSNDGTLVLRSSNVQNRNLSFDDNVYVNIDKGDFNPVKCNDILLCVRNGSKELIGKSAIIDFENEGHAFGAFMAIFRSSENKFLFHLFDSDIFYRQVHRNLGATINSINGSNLRKFIVPFPPSNERKAIASILSDWDKAMKTTSKLINKLRYRKLGLVQQLLGGKTRLKGYEREWETIKAHELFENYSNKNHKGDGIVLSATQDKGVIPRSLTGIDIKYDKSSLKNYKKVDAGDFVISLRSFQGGIEYSKYSGIVSPAYTVLKERKPLSKDFYREYMKTPTFINRLNSMIYGIRDGKQISYKEFSSMKFVYPKLEEQKSIAKILIDVDCQIASFENYLLALKKQKAGLMHELFTGKIRVGMN